MSIYLVMVIPEMCRAH